MIQRFQVDPGTHEPATVGFAGIVPVIGGASLPIRTIGPDLGEHTREVLATVLRRTGTKSTPSQALRKQRFRDDLHLHTHGAFA